MTTLANDSGWVPARARRTPQSKQPMKSSISGGRRRFSGPSIARIVPQTATGKSVGVSDEGTPELALVPGMADREGLGEASGIRRPTIRSGTLGDEDANLKIYLQEISETPLLSQEDEANLAGRVQAGDEAARQIMITANLRLVVKIAKDFMGMGLPLLDMINEGNLGLMRAVDRFDPTKGAKLSTYAAWWIKQSIRRGLANQGKTIRLPVHLVDLVARMRRASLKFHEEVGRDPSDTELAELLGMTQRRVTELWDASQRTTSLDAPLGDDEDNQLADVVPDERAQTAFQEMERGTRHEMIRDLLGQLEGRELWILQERFGLDGRSERTLEDLGKEAHLTRERIRQIEHHALKKMRRLVERREAQLDPDLAPFQECLRAA